MIVSKTINTHIAIVGECIRYKIILTNDEGYTIEDIVISDQLEEALKFVEGSLTYNGIQGDGDIVAGVKIDQIPAHDLSQHIITFDVLILSQPYDKKIGTSTTVTYTHKDTYTGKKQLKTEQSDMCYFVVCTPSLTLYKQQDKAYAPLGEKVSYTLTVMNTGDVDFVNILVQDQTSIALKVVPGSIRIDGKVIHIESLKQGINIAKIPCGGQKHIQFEACVTEGTGQQYVGNKAVATGTYILPDDTIGIQYYTSNEVKVDTGLKCYKQLLLERYLTIPKEEKIKEIDDVVVTVKVIDFYPVATPIVSSREGMLLTGTELVIHSMLKVDLSYTSLDSYKSMRFLTYKLPFNTEITLPRHYKKDKLIKVVAESLTTEWLMENSQKMLLTMVLQLKANVFE